MRFVPCRLLHYSAVMQDTGLYNRPAVFDVSRAIESDLSHILYAGFGTTVAL
jgi:hypothetical protein